MSLFHNVIIAFTSFVCCSVLGHGNDTQDFSVKKHSALVVCYYRSWSVYRPDVAKFSESGIDPNLCSHVIYAFVGINGSTYEIQTIRSSRDLSVNEGGAEFDLGNGFHNVVNLKKSHPHLKVMLAIGGWDEGSRKYSDMVSLRERRQIFIRSVIKFLRKYEFDGLDFHWRHPTYRDGRPEDKENFVELLKEMKPEFDRDRLLLSTTMPPDRSLIDIGFDVPQVARYSDFLTVMSYIYNGVWNSRTGFYAPLYDPVPNPSWGQSVNFTISYLLYRGAPAEKITLGLSFEGHSFLLNDKEKNGVNAPASGRTETWYYSQTNDYILYLEVCHELNQPGWTVKSNEIQKVTYAFKENLWLSYEDEYSIDLKVKYAVDQRLGGVNIWAIDADDISGICGHGSFPLTKTVNKAFTKYLTMHYDKCCNKVSKTEITWTIWMLLCSLTIWCVTTSA